MNCSTQPVTNRASAQRHLKKNSGQEIVIIGTPNHVTEFIDGVLVLRTIVVDEIIHVAP